MSIRINAIERRTNANINLPLLDLVRNLVDTGQSAGALAIHGVEARCVRLRCQRVVQLCGTRLRRPQPAEQCQRRYLQ
jgi:hypothetical protein